MPDPLEAVALPCTAGDPDRFFPGERITRAEAKRLCAGCPVLAKCLAYAIAAKEQGIWGGSTEEMRAGMGGRRTPILRRKQAAA